MSEAGETRCLTFDLSGVRLRLDRLPAEWAARLEADWSGFEADDENDAFLRLRVELGGAAIPPVEAFDPKTMRSGLDPRGAWFEMPEGRAVLGLDGSGKVILAGDGADHAYYALLNLVRACLAWSMPSRGGALLHAAGIELDGRAFVLVGPEGSGKTTWARLSGEAGVHVISDDLLLLDRPGAAFEVLGGPFYSRHEVRHLRGRWPLAAVLFPQHGSPAGCAPSPVLRARARLTANLPFVAEAIESDGRIARVVDRLVEGVPCLDLTFGLDTGFLPVLRTLETPS